MTQKTAAELITERANPADPHFGLQVWKGDKVRKADVVVAKNYLSEDELDTLNRLVVIFLETAELRAKSKHETRMAVWKQNVDQIITSNGFPLLTHVGSISHEQMEARTGELYRKFDEDRKVGGEDKTFKVARFAMVHADREAVVFTTHRRASWFPSEKAALQVRDRIQPKVPESVLEVVSYTPPVKHRLRHVQGGGQ